MDAELDFLDAIRSDYYKLEPLTAIDVERCRELIARYRSLDIGLADAAVIATAERLNIRRILTVDERDFGAISPRQGPFILLQADAINTS